AELKSKWFIPMDGSEPDGVPCQRHTDDAGENALAVSTDGNRVSALIDGQSYMRRWHQSIIDLQGAPSAELYHAGWRFEDVMTLGVTQGPPDALDDVINAHLAGVTTYILADRNILMMTFNEKSVL